MTKELNYKPLTVDDMRNAQKRIAESSVVRTPLIPLNIDLESPEIYLKLENLQPVGSFKLRGISNTVRQIPETELKDGVWTVSAGNTAQALAWVGRDLGITATAVVPENAPETKLQNIIRLGGRFVKAPFEEFARVFATRTFPGINGRFIHPFSDPMMMAGNATIGLEILEDIPDVDTVIAAYGGGGLCCGVGSAIKAIKPETKVYAAEAVTSAPLAAALEANLPKRIDYSLSFVDAIGSPIVQPEMFSLARQFLEGSLVVSLEDTAEAIRILAKHNHVISEGGGAVPIAAAITGKGGNGKVVCVVSGGNIDPNKLATILEGTMP